ncbi:MAG: alpha-N-arabinofuranosidase [Candidatus Marinimicrobia bacterium]|nr:alpha-N-arabinofuranosidase [Candidatus Neomarinimicrobiota bacterium]MCF7828104.1 alpha-N-arabinofuranosidase [Candidatus Neomarinimicrobiota bacterium]MCF7879721.1 alpha-N-arabinofuranosidase [Candidatus Neomarinimicrobiota bacterium]
MIRLSVPKKLTMVVLCFVIGTGIPAQDSPEMTATVQISETGEPIHPYVYGMFTELLGNIFEHGLWAEMLSDRKFFYPVDTTTTLTPVNTRRNQNRWRPIGGPTIVEMDSTNSYVGEHTPMLPLSETQPRGIQQSGLTLAKDMGYTGRIVLAGDPSATVNVSLVWGLNPEERETVTIRSVTDDYLKYPLSFTAGTDTENGILEVTATGTGKLYVGAVSLMRADNIQGFRSDIVELLRELDSGIYRWPGGNMLAGYNWRDGVGDIDKRPPRYDYAWNAVESNDVGTEEFLVLCDLLGIDPYLVVNIGFGDEQTAADWVEYVNGSPESPMGRLRAMNGHPEPYEVKWWGIGNEMYGEWQLGHMSIEHYILKHNLFAEAMLDVDPSIKLIGCGANPFETSTTARHHRKPLPDSLPYEFGSRQDWSGKLLDGASHNMDFLAEHLYPVTDQAFDADSQKFVPVNDPVVDQVRRVPNRVKAIAESWEHYVEAMPQLKESSITFAVDEWTGGGWGSGFVRTLCAAEGLHEMFRHSDIITMGGYTAVTSNVRWTPTDATYTSIGLLFKLYRHHFGTIPVQITGNSPQHHVKGTIGVDLPAETSGSDTYPLDVVAALTENGDTVTVAITNPTESVQEISLEFDGSRLRNNTKQYQIAVPELQTRNVPGEEPAIMIEETDIGRMPGTIEVAPWSITLYEIGLR